MVNIKFHVSPSESVYPLDFKVKWVRIEFIPTSLKRGVNAKVFEFFNKTGNIVLSRKIFRILTTTLIDARNVRPRDGIDRIFISHPYIFIYLFMIMILFRIVQIFHWVRYKDTVKIVKIPQLCRYLTALLNLFHHSFMRILKRCSYLTEDEKDLLVESYQYLEYNIIYFVYYSDSDKDQLALAEILLFHASRIMDTLQFKAN